MRKKGFVRSGILIILCCVMALTLPRFNAEAASNEMQIHCIYLGSEKGQEGDCVLVESNGEYLLMDMGYPETYPKVKSFLQSKGVTELSLYYSHLHKDHTGGLRDGEGYDKLLGDFKVNHVYVPDKSIGKDLYGTASDGTSGLQWNYNKITDLYQEHYPDADINKTVSYLKVGSTFSFGSVNAKVMGPIGMDNKTVSSFMKQADNNANEAKNIYLNNCSLATMLTCGNTKYFTAGDVDTYEEKQLADKYGKALKADIYKMSHHGYANSTTAAIMNYIRPTYSFAPNSGMATGFTSDSTTNHRKVYTAMRVCNRYGFAYLVGSEKKNFTVAVKDNAVKLYSGTQQLKGYIAVTGADGKKVKQDHYLLDANSKPLTGVQTYNGKKYYFGTGGCQEYGLYSGSNYNPWRSYEESGKKMFRYFDETTHEMKTGFINTAKGTTYYCSPDTGFRYYGFLEKKGKTYYFGNAGTMYKNKWLTHKKNKIYFTKSGEMAVGWVKINGKKTYFNEDGTRSRGLTKIGKYYYYMNNTGNTKKYANWYVVVDKYKFKFDAKGRLKNPPSIKKTTLKKVAVSGDIVNATWNKVKGAKGYTIYISTKSNKGYQEAGTVSGSKTSLKVKGLEPGTYYVKVAAYKQYEKAKFYGKTSNVKKIVIR